MSIPYRYEKLYKSLYFAASQEANKTIYTDVLGDTDGFSYVIYKCISEIVRTKNDYEDYSREWIVDYLGERLTGSALKTFIKSYDNLFIEDSLRDEIRGSASNWELSLRNNENVDAVLMSRASSTVQHAPSGLSAKMDYSESFSESHLDELLNNGLVSETPMDSIIIELFKFYKECFEKEWESVYEKASYIDVADYELPEELESKIVNKAYNEAKSDWSKGTSKIAIHLLVCALVIALTFRYTVLLGIAFCIVAVDLMLFIPDLRTTIPQKPNRKDINTFMRYVKLAIVSEPQCEEYKKKDRSKKKSRG